MTDSKVSADLPQREPGEALKAAIKQVRVSELMRGDWVSAGFMHDRNAVEVLTVEAYNDDHDGVFCKVLGRFHAEGEPSMFTRYAADTVLLADDEEIEAQQALWRRSRVVAHLNRVVMLIQDDELPVGGPSDPVRISLRLNDVDELHRLAETLGAQVKTDGVEFTVMWPATEREAASAPVEVVWRAYRSDIAADPLGQLYSREPESYVGTAPVPAHVDGVSMTGREPVAKPRCTPDCDALQSEAGQAITGSARTWHADGCPVPVHHHATDGVTECGEALSNLPPAHGFETGGWGITDCQLCLVADRDAEPVKRISSIDPDSSMEAHYDAEIEARQRVPLAGREVVVEHYEKSGWKDDLSGNCGVECVCGVAFGGFASLDEAGEQLKQHIADEAGQ